MIVIVDDKKLNKMVAAAISSMTWRSYIVVLIACAAVILTPIALSPASIEAVKQARYAYHGTDGIYDGWPAKYQLWVNWWRK